MTAGGWRVVVLDDSVNTFAVAAYILHRVAAVSIPDAWQHAERIHQDGSAVVAEFDDVSEAERIVGRLHVMGMTAVVRETQNG